MTVSLVFKRINTLIAVAFIPVFLVAQQNGPVVISSAGVAFHGSNIELDWTLGEVLIETLENDTYILTQGYHQPYLTVTSTETPQSAIAEINVYPNPVNERLQVAIQLRESANVEVRIINLLGQELWRKSLDTDSWRELISFTNWISGTYFLTVFIDGRITQTFKLQKQ